MDDLHAKVATQLADRYEILREVGRGGMATVYLARDRRHDRQVAIKVFRPDLATGVGQQRFVREIALAATLSHPNIVPLYDSGDAAGMLYYVMPYVVGESVGTRLTRVGQLPIIEALSVARQVAAALQYAHDAGVVHRDIKPDNILLSGELALVADFGIAHAAEQSADLQLTADGYAVGTPAYMSPEQCTGSTRVDRRSDIYSLGCVLYTMLIGEPPFSGITAQATLARHLAEPVPSLRVVRSTVPRAVEAAVHRALAKAPADRFASAAEFAEAIAPGRISDERAAAVTSRRRPWLPVAIAGVVVAGLLAAIRPWSLVRTTPHGTGDPDIVAVVPFRVTAVLDSGERQLMAHVSDLIVQRLPGDGGPRGVTIAPGGGDPDHAARAAARSAAAGLVIQGNASSLQHRLVFDATIKSVENDSILGRVDGMTGSDDSLPVLLDRVVAGLLVTASHIPDTERPAIAALPLPAIRAYLAAYRAFVRGEFADAGRRYDQVLAVDSTCYPAALGLGAVAIMLPDTTTTRRAITLVATSGHTFDFRDSLYLNALAWPLDPAGTVADRMARFDHAVAKDGAPATRWFLLGYRLMYDGPFLGLPDVLHRAAVSFDAALHLEPDFVPALGASIDLAAARGDTVAVRRLATRYFALDSTGTLADYYRWRVAVALGDAKTLGTIRGRITTLERSALERLVNVAQIDGVALPDALQAATALWQQGGTGGQARWAFIKERELALNRGRRSDATGLLDHWQATIPFMPRDELAEVVNALYWQADTTVPARWAARIAPVVDAARRPAGVTATDWSYDICGLDLWRIAHGTVAGVASGVRQLRATDALAPNHHDMSLCADVIDAQLARRTAARDAGARLERLDSIARSAPPVITWILVAANLTAAQLWEVAGAPAKALAAVRRRPYVTDLGEPRVLVALSTMLRDEGRLAALTGDTTTAIGAYRRYLALRDAPDAALVPEVTAVRAAMDRLARASHRGGSALTAGIAGSTFH